MKHALAARARGDERTAAELLLAVQVVDEMTRPRLVRRRARRAP